MLNASSAQNFTYSDYLNSTEKSAENIDKLRPPKIDSALASFSSNMNLIGKIPEGFQGIKVYNEQNELVGEATASDEVVWLQRHILHYGSAMQNTVLYW